MTLRAAITVLVMVAMTFVLAPRTATGQELELVQIDDFIDPVELVTFSPEGTPEQRGFLAARGIIGVAHNYQYRSERVEGAVGVAHIKTNYYYSIFQGSWELTGLRAEERASAPRLRSRVSASFYLDSKESFIDAISQRDPDDMPGRFTLFWNVEDVESDALEHELGIRMDVSYSDPSVAFIGGFIFAIKPEQNDHYYGLAYRYTLQEPRPFWYPRLGIGISADRTGGVFYGGVVRGDLSLEIPTPVFSTTANIMYSLSHHLTQDWTNNEIAVFLNLPVGSRLF